MSEDSTNGPIGDVLGDIRKSMILVALSVAAELGLFDEQRCVETPRPSEDAMQTAHSGKFQALIALLVAENYLVMRSGAVHLAPKGKALSKSRQLRSYLKWRFLSMAQMGRVASVFRDDVPTIFGTKARLFFANAPTECASFHAAMEAVVAPVLNEVISRMTEVIATQGYSRLFELGCGTGWLAAALLCRFSNLKADLIDVSTSTARQHNATSISTGRCRVHQRDFLECEWPAFDVLVACDVLSNLTDAELLFLIDKAEHSSLSEFHIFEPVADSPQNSESTVLSRFILATETDGFVRSTEQWEQILQRFRVSFEFLSGGFVHIVARKQTVASQ